MKYSIGLILVLAGLSVSSCTPDIWQSQVVMAKMTHVNYNVEFNARAGGNTGPLQTFSANKNCAVPTGRSRQGCVAFEKDTYGSIMFTLRNEGGANADECGESGVQWVITKVEATTTPDPADDNKGSAWGSALPAWAVSAFYPIEDATTGLLYTATLAEGNTAFVLQNRNNSSTAQVLWYRVTASRCGTNPVRTKVSDPRVENKGLN